MTFLLLKEKFPDVLRQYKSNVYPYHCDFYIPSKNLYIEYQGNWTHGGHPFDLNNADDIKELDRMRSKNTKYYNTAINVWTKTDPNKRRIAIENHLNFVEFWNLEDVEKWLMQF